MTSLPLQLLVGDGEVCGREEGGRCVGGRKEGREGRRGGGEGGSVPTITVKES